jgi:hypothetical protein
MASTVMSLWVGPIPPVVKTSVQIFRDISDVLVLGAAGQDLVPDHQERSRDNLFGSGRVGG